jgi:hypothetical protein
VLSGRRGSDGRGARAGIVGGSGVLYRFAQEAFAALMEREPDPIEAEERAAVAGLEGPVGT